MNIRKFNEEDIIPVIDLFYDTVHAINKFDYSQKQLVAWANPLEREQRHVEWLKTLCSHYTLVAEHHKQIIGFIDLTTNGVLDRLYVHKNFQRQKVASSLFEEVVKHANRLGLHRIMTEASITAKPFFEKQGFQQVKEQEIEKSGIIMNNYLMVLDITNS
ncbi:GNAT family N-acetyltransferase [Alkalihalobacillus sp. R86527]|uniref:GNAT family N-acetyltransferase n=1 Tax=Alkalihalobacillus sp. R86527 TaxID=3093863 RepID=UPI00366CCFD7